jgi:hypothetical protein
MAHTDAFNSAATFSSVASGRAIRMLSRTDRSLRCPSWVHRQVPGLDPHRADVGVELAYVALLEDAEIRSTWLVAWISRMPLMPSTSVAIVSAVRSRTDRYE